MRKKKIVIISIAIVILMLVVIALSGVGTVKETSSDKMKYETIEKHTSPVEAVFDFYGNKNQVMIYDEIPFENGTLILADKITDGEHYPELHYINQEGYLTHMTHGSYCWTLNYTYFNGYVIYYGLAETETRRFGRSPASVKRIEAVVGDKVESVVPKDKLVASINLEQSNKNIFDSCQGYILPIKGYNLAEDFISIYNDGEKMSLSQKSIDYCMEQMPEYLKTEKKDIYNSFAFTFSPMLTPTEWDKAYSEGEICLKGKKDKNGNENSLNLMTAGFMRLIDSFIVPLHIKFLYCSYDYTMSNHFSPGEIINVVYPEERSLLDCRILELTKQKVEKEISQDSLKRINTNEKRQIKLPGKSGYYLFLLRTNKELEVQTYYRVFKIE